MVAKIEAVYCYSLDAEDRIVSVDDWWLAFASENGAAELDRKSVLGRQVWEFICDEPTRTLYREIHNHVRATGHPIVVPFRCDSPMLQRFMQLRISLHADGQLHYESRLIRVVPQARLGVLDPTREKSNNVLTMCSMCKRSLLEPVGWLDLQAISLQLRMFDQQKVPQLRYTVCPQCSNATSKALTAESVG